MSRLRSARNAARSAATSGWTIASIRVSAVWIGGDDALQRGARRRAPSHDRLREGLPRSARPPRRPARRGDARRHPHPRPARRRRRTSAAVVDLPMPIEPVRPSRYVIRAPPRASRFDLGPLAEPALEPRHGLVQQHAEAVDGVAAHRLAPTSSSRCLERRVDDIGDDRAWRSPSSGTRSAACRHAERGGVHHGRRMSSMLPACTQS